MLVVQSGSETKSLINIEKSTYFVYVYFFFVIAKQFAKIVHRLKSAEISSDFVIFFASRMLKPANSKPETTNSIRDSQRIGKLAERVVCSWI